MAVQADEQVLSARWVFPVSGPPRPRGTVTVRAGRIESVDAAGSRSPDIDFGNAAIIPGLVNAHTHLDLSHLRAVVPPSSDFVSWLRRVIGHRRTATAADTQKSISAGLKESVRFGTTLMGDIAAVGASWDALANAPVWAMCFREVLGLPAGRVAGAWRELVDWMHAHPDTATCRAGVSPHAPYSVHRAVIEGAARLWPICIHLAESEAERALIDGHAGPFVAFLEELGVWEADGLAPSWDWVVWKAGRAPRSVLAHGNYLSPTTKLAPGSTIVYCPRTHAAFGHAPHPLDELLERGIRVALGTDSLASNPDLDVLAEGRFVRTQRPDIPGEAILRMATLAGAEALGFEGVTGSLTPGKSADLVVVPLPDAEEADPHELLLMDEAGTRRTMWRGGWRE